MTEEEEEIQSNDPDEEAFSLMSDANLIRLFNGSWKYDNSRFCREYSINEENFIQWRQGIRNEDSVVLDSLSRDAAIKYLKQQKRVDWLFIRLWDKQEY